MMTTAFQDLVKHRQLLYMIAWRDIRIKYKQSVMGFMWAIFMPIMIITAGILVKTAFAYLRGEQPTIGDVATVAVKVASLVILCILHSIFNQ